MPLRGYWRGTTLAPYIRDSVSDWSSTVPFDKEYLLSQILDEIKPIMEKKMLSAEPDKKNQTYSVLRRMNEFVIWKTVINSLYDNGFEAIGRESLSPLSNRDNNAMNNRYVKVRE